jgi:hypothetical protein
MKKLATIIIILFALSSCNKDEEYEQDIDQNGTIENKLFSGTGVTSFQRIISNGRDNIHFNSLKQTSDFGYIFCGYMFLDDGPKIFVLKTNQSGESEWNKTFSFGLNSIGWNIVTTHDNCFLISAVTYPEGWSSFFPASDGMLLKIDNNGELVWEKLFSLGDVYILHSVRATDDGGFIALGYTFGHDISSPNQDYLIKTDAKGEEVWRKIFNFKGRLRHIEETADEGFVLCGNNESGTYILKVNSLGEEQWSNIITLDNYYNGSANSIKELSDGYVVCGWHSNTDVYRFVSRLDNLGNEVWTKNYDSGFIEEPNMINPYKYDHELKDIIKTSDNNFIAVGFESYDNVSYSYLIKISSDTGDIIWQKLFSPGDSNRIVEVQNSADNGFVLAGTTASYDAKGYLKYKGGYIVKTD